MELTKTIGPGRVAHCSGALLLEETGTLVIADAHLGYGWAQRRRGQLGPISDGGIADRLLAVVAELGPAELLFLGDTVHAPRPMAAERAFIEGVLRGLMAKTRVRIVEGNHDRAFRRDFSGLGLTVEPQWRQGGLLALHGDKLRWELPEAEHYVLGHVHPAIGVRDDAGAKKRIPAFLAGERATLIPAFSPFSSGLDIGENPLPEEVRELLGACRIYAATGKRIVELPMTLH